MPSDLEHSDEQCPQVEFIEGGQRAASAKHTIGEERIWKYSILGLTFKAIHKAISVDQNPVLRTMLAVNQSFQSTW
jgi:hypothetical protein